MRDNVEAFIKNKGKAANPTESPVINGMDGGPTAVTSPLINKPPPPMLPPPMGVGQYPPVKGAPVVPMYSAPPGYKPASMMLAPANIGYDAPNMWRPSNGVFELPPVEFFPLPLTEEEFYIEKELQWKEYKANRDLSRKNFHGRGAGYRGEYRGRSPQERFREQDFPNKRNHDGAAGRFARDREGANHRNDNFNYRSSSAKRSFSRERRGRSAEKNFDKNEHSKYNDAATDSRGSKSNSLVDRRDSRHRSRSPHGSKQSDSRARHNRGDSRSRAEKVRSSRDRSSRDKSYNLNDRKSEKNDRSFNHDSSRHDDRSSSIFSKKDSKRTDDRKDRKQDRRDTDDTDHNHKKRKTETADDKYTEASSQKSSSRASDRPGKVELVKNKIDDRDERDYRASKTTDNSRENQDDRKTSHRSGRLDEDRSQRESGHREKSHKDKSHRDKDRHSSRSEHSKDKDSKSRSKRSGHNSSKTEAKIILQDPDLNQPLKSHRSNDSSKHDKKKRRH